MPALTRACQGWYFLNIETDNKKDLYNLFVTAEMTVCSGCYSLFYAVALLAWRISKSHFQFKHAELQNKQKK